MCIRDSSQLRPTDSTFIHLDRVPACVGRTDKRTYRRMDRRNCCRYYSALHCKQCGRAVKNDSQGGSQVSGQDGSLSARSFDLARPGLAPPLPLIICLCLFQLRHILCLLPTFFVVFSALQFCVNFSSISTFSCSCRSSLSLSLYFNPILCFGYFH